MLVHSLNHHNEFFTAIIYFVIYELPVIPQICCYVLPFEQKTLNCAFSTVYSMFRALFFENSCSKASRLLLIFICVSMGHAYFQNNEIRISWEPTRPAMVFFICEMTINTTRKASLWRVSLPSF